MATAPFNINQLVPADNDFASQFPATERLYRDIVESWFLVDGNNMGRKNKLSLDHQENAPAGVANVVTVWADQSGLLQARNGTGSIFALMHPLGVVLEHSLPTLPEGFIWADGSAVTSTYPAYRAALVAAGNPYGTDGTDPLRPDHRERVAAGKGNMGGTSSPGRLDSAVTLGGSQGTKSITLSSDNMPSHTHSIGSVADHFHYEFNTSSSLGGLEESTYPTRGANWPSDAAYIIGGNATAPTLGRSSLAGGHTHSLGNTGGGVAHTNVQPTLILNFIIRAY